MASCACAARSLSCSPVLSQSMRPSGLVNCRWLSTGATACHVPVLIVGAGLGGLAASLTLQRRNIPHVVVESAEQLSYLGGGAAGAGIALWGPALDALQEIDSLERRLGEFGHYMSTAQYRSASTGQTLIQAQLGVDGQHVSRCLCLRRAVLQDILLSAQHTHGASRLRLGSTLLSAAERDTMVQCKIKESSGRVYTLSADYVLGCDGLHSTVRRIVRMSWGDSNDMPLYAGYAYYQAVIASPQLWRAHTTAFESWGSGLRFAYVPLRYPEVYWFFSEECREPLTKRVTHATKEQLEYIQQRVSKLHDPIPELVATTELSDILFTPIYQVSPSASWVSKGGRLVLMGDAAHACAPNLAQGACLALEDALCVGSLVADATHAGGNVTVGIEFQRRRQQRAKVVRAGVDLVAAVGMATGVMRRVLDRALYTIPKAISQRVFGKVHRMLLGDPYEPPPLCEGHMYKRILGDAFFKKLSAPMKRFHSPPSQRDARVVGRGRVTIARGKGLCYFLGWLTGLPSASSQAHNVHTSEAHEPSVYLLSASSCPSRYVHIYPASSYCEPLTATVGRVYGTSSSLLWTRIFGSELPSDDTSRRVFETVQTRSRGHLVEHYGLLKFHFSLRSYDAHLANDTGLHTCSAAFCHRLSSASVRIPGTKTRVQIPKFVLPVGDAVSVSTEAGWFFSVSLRLPSWMRWLTLSLEDPILVRYEGHIVECEEQRQHQ